MQPVSPVGFPQQAAPASPVGQPGAAPATSPVFAGKTPAINFGCTTDQVQFGSNVKFGSDDNEGEAKEKKGFKKGITNRYILPGLTLAAGAFVFIAPAPLHMIPVLGTLAATPLHIIGAGVALAGAAWLAIANHWFGKKDKADASEQTDTEDTSINEEEPADEVNTDQTDAPPNTDGDDTVDGGGDD